MIEGKIPSKRDNASSASEEADAARYNYLSKVMTLMWAAMMARPDISYAVGVAARFVQNPGPRHIKWVDHIFYYLNGTKDLVLIYDGNVSAEQLRNLKFRIFSDTSWIDELDDRHTTMGRAVFLGKCLIDWKSKLIRRIMTSTYHAEFYGLNESDKDAEFYRILFQSSLFSVFKAV